MAYLDIPKDVIPHIAPWVWCEMFHYKYGECIRCELSTVDFRYKAIKELISNLHKIE